MNDKEEIKRLQEELAGLREAAQAFLHRATNAGSDYEFFLAKSALETALAPQNNPTEEKGCDDCLWLSAERERLQLENEELKENIQGRARLCIKEVDWLLSFPRGIPCVICTARKEAEIKILSEARDQVCIECYVKRPINDKGWHTHKEGGDILLVNGECRATYFRKRIEALNG